MKTKVCTKCKLVKLLSEFPKNKKLLCGHDSWCKSCKNKGIHEAQQRNIERKRLDGRLYYTRHKEKINEKNKKWRLANPDKKRRMDSEYYKTNKQKIIEYAHQWYEENKDRAKKKVQEYNAKHPEICRNASRVRRAKKRAGGGGFTPKQWIDLCNQYGNKCLCCGKTNVPLTADHVISLFYGGANVIENIQPLCKSCNSKKGIKTTDYRHAVFSTLTR